MKHFSISLKRRWQLAVALMACVIAVGILALAFTPVRLRAQSPNLFAVKQLRVQQSSDLRGDVTIGGSTSAGDISADNLTVSGIAADAITVTGSISLTGTYVGITPVATATAVNTATPQPTFAAVATATARPHWCGVQTVNGSATVIPATLTAAGVTTPRAPVATLGEDITVDGNSVTVANASGVVTLKVWQLRTAATTTPQAATTPVVVDFCVDGN